MSSKRFSNQTRKQILKHLENFLSPASYYNLFVDPLNIYFEIKESAARKSSSEKEKGGFSWMSKGKRKHLSTRKHVRPKIRSVKKGRTVNLKGVVY